MQSNVLSLEGKHVRIANEKKDTKRYTAAVFKFHASSYHHRACYWLADLMITIEFTLQIKWKKFSSRTFLSRSHYHKRFLHLLPICVGCGWWRWYFCFCCSVIFIAAVSIHRLLSLQKYNGHHQMSSAYTVADVHMQRWQTELLKNKLILLTSMAHQQNITIYELINNKWNYM